MNTTFVRMAVLAAGLSLTACSSIVEGTTQSFTVTSDPSGALCELQRNGEVIGAVNPTPGTIQVDKSKHDISVHCSKQGYQPQVENARYSFEAMTIGNLLFGGIIGLGVDLATGATNEYPPSVFVRLMPNSFRSSMERESYFAKERQRINMEADAALQEAERLCQDGSTGKSGERDDSAAECAAAREAIEQERRRLLDELLARY